MKQFPLYPYLATLVDKHSLLFMETGRCCHIRDLHWTTEKPPVASGQTQEGGSCSGRFTPDNPSYMSIWTNHLWRQSDSPSHTCWLSIDEINVITTSSLSSLLLHQNIYIISVMVFLLMIHFVVLCIQHNRLCHIHSRYIKINTDNPCKSHHSEVLG